MRLGFLLFLLGVGFAVSDATESGYVTGRLEQDTTWRATVYVGGDVTIAAGATLTLAPHTQVLFLPYRDETRGGLDSTRAELIVEGRLAAQAGGIVFGSADAASLGADWYGLVVERGGRADVSYAVIRDGLRCVYAQRGGFVRMDAVAFANCGKPIAPADAAKPATPKGTERKEELGLSINATPSINQPFEIQEITVHISGEHKAVILALLAAVDEEMTVTGIAELDSLAATYGLIGIDRKGRISPFYGNRFRLTFPPGADGAAIAKAYRSLPYIQSIKSGDSLTMKGMHIENAGLRLLAKVAAGTGSGLVVTAITVGVLGDIYERSGDSDGNTHRTLGFFLFGASIGCSVGFPFGVSLVDSYDSLPVTLLAGVIPGVIGYSTLSLSQENFGIASLFMYVAPIIGSLYASEKWRQPPQARRVSVALSPTPNGGLSAVAQLRF